MKKIRFGIIGCGLMGREFASASARWAHLLEMPARPEIVAVCNRSAGPICWFTENFPSIAQATQDYRQLLANPEVQAVYVAVPHHLHAEIYIAAIEAGKHLLGEKPFGIDRAANQSILDALRRHPQALVRCSSQFLFFPPVQRIARMIEQGDFGRLIEVDCGLLHSSDLDPNKPINWKRQIEFNGEYGVLGDLGLHALHVPYRAGWVIRDVRAILSDIIKSRPDGKGAQAPCRTWDNGTLFCQAVDPRTNEPFPLTIKLQRIAPGQRNTWYLSILGVSASARWSSANPKLLEVMRYSSGQEQSWRQMQTGFEPAFNTITGGIFEFGFPDLIQQMWAAFVYELEQGRPLRPFAGCLTPEETARSHALFTAALQSHRTNQVVALP